MLEILKNTGCFVLGTILVFIVFGLPMYGLCSLFIGWFGAYSWLGISLYFLTAMTYCGFISAIIHHWSDK